jgi:uracil-DNA glycosylase
MNQQHQVIQTLLDRSNVHPEWFEILQSCLVQVDTIYLQELVNQDDWLPGCEKLFAAFQRDLTHCKYILLGESPYPRAESANGIAFYDAAVESLWSEKGLSKKVNRATSLRNIIKTALIAEGHLQPQHDGKIPQHLIAQIDKGRLISTIAELFEHLHQLGFLMFNVTPVLHADRKPLIESRYWQGFIQQLLVEIKKHKPDLPTLVLWGKIAMQIDSVAAATEYPRLSSEHPYNLSFIQNQHMQQFFAELQILQP